MGKQILIVDDSSVMRKMIAKTLQGEGHQVAGEARNGREAVEMYKVLRPDLVTMDITMREMDGFAAAKEILRFDEDARIVFLSNLSGERCGEDALKLGAKGYVNKHNAAEILDIIAHDQ